MTTSPTDTPKRSDADLVKELHYIVLCHQPGSERRATLEAVCDMIERLSTPPSQGKVERARELLAQAVEKVNGPTVAGLFRDGAAVEISGTAFIAAITQALTEVSGQGTDGAEAIAIKLWPFVESPGEFASRLENASQCFGSWLAGVRNVLIEEPPTLNSEYIRRALPLPVSADGRDAVIEAAWALINETNYLTVEECSQNRTTPGTGNKLKTALLALKYKQPDTGAGK